MTRPAPARNHLGRQLHTWRIRQNLTLQKAAQILDVSPSTILRWEAGHVEPNERARYRIKRLVQGGSA